MNELLKELERKQKEGKRTISIDYIIDKLKNVNSVWDYVRGEVVFNIESLVNENYMDYDKECKILESMTDEEIDKITEEIYSQDWLFDVINENMNEAITKELEIFINNKK